MTDLLALDPLKVAAQVGHGAAVNAWLAVTSGPERDMTAEASWWSNLGVPKVGLDPLAIADELAESFLPAHGALDGDALRGISGERAFREAAELRLHAARGDAWPDQPRTVHVAFTVFAAAAFATWIELSIEAAVAAAALAAKAKPLRVDSLRETIFDDDDDGPLARDPVAAEAIKSMRAVPRRARAASPAADPEPPPVAAPKRLDPARKMSVGERPLDPSKQVKRQHGGKRVKGGGGGDAV